MTLRRFYTLLFIALTLPFYTQASHITGGSMTYKFLKDSSFGGQPARVYEVQLVIYQDCTNGQPEAIAQDNPAFLSCFRNGSYNFISVDTAVYYTSSELIPSNLSNNCNSITPGYPLCLLKKTFIKRYVLPKNADGYVISYQRCCWSGSVANIKSPGDNGITLTCTIPGSIANSSAEFKNEAPNGICLSHMLTFDHSATDADGDSLSYEFCPALVGASTANIKPIPAPPPYDSLRYLAPFTATQPISGTIPFTIDPTTGYITGLPDRLDRYVVCVRCKEWRNGILINSIYRVFTCVVGGCSVTALSFKPDIGPDTTLLPGQRLRLHGGPGKYHLWKPTTYVSDSSAQDPLAIFPAPGAYQISEYVLNDSGCSGADTITINVISHSDFAIPNAFSPNGDNVNDILTPIPIKGSKLIAFKIFNRWGNLVYNGGPADPGWDGTYKGTLQDMAVYYWHLEYEDTYGDQHGMSGNLTLVR